MAAAAVIPADQSTLIIVTTITAVASITTAGITAYFARGIRTVQQVAIATHNIVNHVRTIELDNQELVLRVAVMDHPTDEQLKLHWRAAQDAATKQREANIHSDTKL